jgi:histone H3/H4
MSLIAIIDKRHGEERLEASMQCSFASEHEADADRVKRKLMRRALARPEETVLLLLRNCDGKDERVRKEVLEILTELARCKPFLVLIMRNMGHSSRRVRKAVQSFLEELVGPHGAVYASLYEQTMLLVAMSKRKDVPVEDIVSLAELSMETFMDGEVIESVRDIGFCLDQVRNRYRSSEQLMRYLSDVLRMAPDLPRRRILSDALEEPLHRGIMGARDRSIRETRERIKERTMEAKLRHDLRSVVIAVDESVSSRPRPQTEGLREDDRQELSALHRVASSVVTSLSEGRRTDAVMALHEFVQRFLRSYGATLRERIRAGDQDAAAVLYQVCLGCVKTASLLVPIAAEGAYLEGFRYLEGTPSVCMVPLLTEAA